MMGFFKSPEEMYKHRASRFKHNGDIHWAKAKCGDGDYHFGKAKKCYTEAEKNLKRAELAKSSNAKFAKRKKK